MNKNVDNNKILKQVANSFCSLFSRFFKGSNSYNANFSDTEVLSANKIVFLKLIKNKAFILGSITFLLILSFSFIGSLFIPLNEIYTELTHANIRPGINFLDFPEEFISDDIVKISSGISFSAAIDNNGNFYLWGTEPNKEQKNVSGYIFDVPNEVYENKIVDIACGGNHIFALDENGNLYGWGYNGNGQLDVPSSLLNSLSTGDITIKQMEAKSQWTAILSDDGEIYIFGSLQAENNFLIPASIQGSIEKFSGGDLNMALLLNDGSISIIGDRGSEASLNIPSEILNSSIKITDVAMSNKNILALDENGAIYTWGSSQDNLLNPPILEEKVLSISAGYKNFLLLLEDKSVYIWGNNIYSQLDFKLEDSINNIFSDYYQFYLLSDEDISAFGNKGFLFGTDHFGRDILSRMVHGGKTSLTVGAIAVFISVSIALFVGLSSGYFGGIVDSILMRITDVFSSIPFYPIAITLSYAIGFEMSATNKLYLIMIILGLLGWMSLARLIRAQLLVEREKDFVLAARSLGLKNSTIMIKHILPNIFNLVIVNITLGYSSSLLSEASLSFLGFGVTEPYPSWGNILTSAQEISIIEFYWWRWLIPAAFVILAALSVNLIGDALREALEPRNNDK